MGQILALLTLSLLFPTFTTSADPIRLALTHIDSTGNFTKSELLQRAVQRSNRRCSALAAKLTGATSQDIEAPVHSSSAAYLLDLSIGTPAFPFSAVLDTGSDLIWTQCQPCVKCLPQPTPLFDPAASSTYFQLPCTSSLCQALPSNTTCTQGCDYAYGYADTSSTQGLLATETFTFGQASVADVGFGCGTYNQGDFANSSGLVGMGRGPLSLISQLGLGKFSYCLTSYTSSTSPLLFGSLAVFNGAAQSTPFVDNPYHPSFYYLSLQGITVGSTLLSIPSSTFAINTDGTGGLVIDSGTSLTYLEQAGFDAVKEAFVSLIPYPVADGSVLGLDLCFAVPAGTRSVRVPRFVLHFYDADMVLPVDNYMYLDSTYDLLCLVMLGSSGVSILGNYQQMSMQIVYDLDAGELSFAGADCDQL